MRSAADLSVRETLERIYNQDRRLVKLAIVRAIVSQIWHYLTASALKKRDLLIRQHWDQFGESWWNAYDPATGYSANFRSESELLTWIEQHYSR